MIQLERFYTNVSNCGKFVSFLYITVFLPVLRVVKIWFNNIMHEETSIVHIKYLGKRHLKKFYS